MADSHHKGGVALVVAALLGLNLFSLSCSNKTPSSPEVPVVPNGYAEFREALSSALAECCALLNEAMNQRNPVEFSSVPGIDWPISVEDNPPTGIETGGEFIIANGTQQNDSFTTFFSEYVSRTGALGVLEPDDTSAVYFVEYRRTFTRFAAGEDGSEVWSITLEAFIEHLDTDTAGVLLTLSARQLDKLHCFDGDCQHFEMSIDGLMPRINELFREPVPGSVSGVFSERFTTDTDSMMTKTEWNLVGSFIASGVADLSIATSSGAVRDTLSFCR